MSKPENTHEGPKRLGDILADVPSILEYEVDPTRKTAAEVTRLTAEVSELGSRLGAVHEDIVTEGPSEAAIDAALDTTHAISQAKLDLEAARDRHPSSSQ